MKLLRDILYRVSLENVIGQTNMAIENICFDSRKVSKFSTFIAIEGTQSDGHDYIDKAIEKGAVAIICNRLPENLDQRITYVEVANTSAALGYLAANFYDNPSLLKVMDISRRNRNLLIIVSSIVYVLNIVDASIDAHLYHFNVSDDLSLIIDPKVDYNLLVPDSYYAGLSLKLKLR